MWFYFVKLVMCISSFDHCCIWLILSTFRWKMVSVEKLWLTKTAKLAMELWWHGPRLVFLPSYHVVSYWCYLSWWDRDNNEVDSKYYICHLYFYFFNAAFPLCPNIANRSYFMSQRKEIVLLIFPLGFFLPCWELFFSAIF